jgi:hypothetical protein
MRKTSVARREENKRKKATGGTLPPVPAAMAGQWLLAGATHQTGVLEPVEVYVLDYAEGYTAVYIRRTADTPAKGWMIEVMSGDQCDLPRWWCKKDRIPPSEARRLGADHTAEDCRAVSQLSDRPCWGASGVRNKNFMCYFGKNYQVLPPQRVSAALAAPAAAPAAATPQELSAAAPAKRARSDEPADEPPAKRVKLTEPSAAETAFLAAVQTYPRSSVQALLEKSAVLQSAVQGAGIKEKRYALNKAGGLVDRLVREKKIVDAGDRKWTLKI